MQSGIHRNLPASEVPEFRQLLLAQAADDDVGLDITETGNADGTRTCAWTVLPPGTAGGSAAAPGVHPDIPDRPPVPSLDTPAPPPPGPPDRFVTARRTAPLTIVYIDVAGREVARQGGSRSWRNNNPGNIQKGPITAIGDDGRFAIFPDEETGHQAIVALLRSTNYRSLTLQAAIFRYAPPVENDSGRYLEFVSHQTGLPTGVVMGTLSDTQLGSVADVIKKVEGWTPGTERPNGPAPGVVPGLMGVPQAVSTATRAAQEWMDIAEREEALPEHERSAWPDPGENPRILEYFRVAAPWFESGLGDETDWCAAFVNYCLVMGGHFGTDHPGARSFFWNRKGQFVRLDAPRLGAIAVRRNAPFDDPDWVTGSGHVGFVTAFTADGVTLLGGNQAHSVNRQPFPLQTHDAQGHLAARFVAFVMPVMA